METYQGISSARLRSVLDAVGQVRVLLVGDICLDVYWSADMTKSSLSRETAHFPLPVVQERLSAGAGGNVAANLRALCPRELYVVGAIGDDWRGNALREVFARSDISTDGLITVADRVTNAYCKPMRFGYSGTETEDPRLDFESYEPLPAAAEAQMIEKLRRYADKADIICVSDQFAHGCITPAVREEICRIAQTKPVIADSRSRIGYYRNVILKPNEIECARALGLDDNRLDSRRATMQDAADAAVALSAQSNASVCVTLGDRGCIAVFGGKATFVPAVPVKPPVDIVGAGDCFLSAFSLALAAGAEVAEAACIGNLASGVTIQKIGTTGTASPEEILRHYQNSADNTGK